MAPELRYDVVNGIAYTYVNGVPGPLNNVDARTHIEFADQLSEGARYVEVGSYLGCSALLVALHSKARIWAHDVWTADWTQLKGDPPPPVVDCYAKFLNSLRENCVEDRITPVRGDSAHTL